MSAMFESQERRKRARFTLFPLQVSLNWIKRGKFSSASLLSLHINILVNLRSFSYLALALFTCLRFDALGWLLIERADLWKEM